jgi:hypothetical protein
MYGYDGYYVEVKVASLSSGLFDTKDMEYVWGHSKEKPLDFDLHLACHLLENGGLPTELLEPVQQWVRENKTVVPSYNLVKGVTI